MNIDKHALHLQLYSAEKAIGMVNAMLRIRSMTLSTIQADGEEFEHIMKAAKALTEVRKTLGMEHEMMTAEEADQA